MSLDGINLILCQSTIVLTLFNHANSIAEAISAKVWVPSSIYNLRCLRADDTPHGLRSDGTRPAAGE
jgi:hypothetical protein